MRNMRKAILRGDLLAIGFKNKDLEALLLERLESYSDEMTDEETDDYVEFVERLEKLNDLKLEALLRHQKELDMLEKTYLEIRKKVDEAQERYRRSLTTEQNLSNACK